MNGTRFSNERDLDTYLHLDFPKKADPQRLPFSEALWRN